MCPELSLPSSVIIHLLYQRMCAVSSLRQCPVTTVVCVLTLFSDLWREFVKRFPAKSGLFTFMFLGAAKLPCVLIAVYL